MDHLLRKPEAGVLCRTPVSTLFLRLWHFTFYTGAIALFIVTGSRNRGRIMQPDQNTPPTIQDSVVGRDMHTGNVIHNHYHLAPTPQTPAPPQTIVIQQPQPQPQMMNAPGAYFIPIKKLHTVDWIVFGALSIFFSFVPALNMCCGIVSVVGVLSMLPHLHLSKSNNHPESGKIVPALVLNVIAVFASAFLVILYFS